MRTPLTNKTYIKTATASVPLFYPRSQMLPGTKIKGFKTNKRLIDGLASCESVVFSMYWKPVGDSLLFLSVVQACHEYLKLIRDNQIPELLVDDQFSSLVKHIPILSSCKSIKNGVSWFKETVRRGKKVTLVTDDDPFKMPEKPPVFNTEEYVYPKFYEILNGGQVKEYPSRPARYFLTFEREVGVMLKSDPNCSLPDFIMSSDDKLRRKCVRNFKFNPDENRMRFIAIVSQAGMAEKKFGSLRYLNITDKIIRDDKKDIVLFLANSKEESPSEWLQVLGRAKSRKYKVRFINTDDFELLAYIFARCRLVVGNDTGFSHLAAMSKKSPIASNVPCIVTYSRHDYGKWSTGKENVYPIATELSEYLRENNISISRDKIDVSKWGMKEWACSIPEEAVVKKINSIWRK